MAGIRPNRPARMPEVPVKIKEDGAGASKSAAPVAGKGKEIVKLTDKEQAKLNAKIQKSEMKAAMEASIISENKRIGAGPSGTAGESLPSSPASSQGTLGRSQTFPASSSSNSEVTLSDISRGSTPTGSPVPSWIEGRTPHGSETSSNYFTADSNLSTPHGSVTSSQYYTASSSFGSSSGSELTRFGSMSGSEASTPRGSDPSTPRASEPTTSGSSHHSRSSSESSVSAFSLNGGNIIEFQRDMQAVMGRTIEPGVWHTETTKAVLNDTKLDVHGRKIVDKIVSAHYEPGKVVQPHDPLNFIDFPNGVEAKRMIDIPSALQAGMNPNDHLVAIPELHSGPSSPAVRPTADQDGRPTFPESTSLGSLLASKSSNSSVDWEIPETKWPEPPAPQKQNALGNLSTKAKIGLAAAAGLTAGGALAAGMLGSADDSDSAVQM